MSTAATSVATDVLTVDNLSVQYGTGGNAVAAVTRATLRVGAGEAVGLVGESGSGKSTLARTLLGLLPEHSARITGGTILVDNLDVTGFVGDEWRAVRGHPVAMVFQDPMAYLNPIMRIGRQIAESLVLHSPDEPRRARISELLDMVRLPAETADKYPHELSGGMRQRALIASALACRPQLLVADEPTTALDVTTQARILDMLQDVRSELGMALLLISHDLGVVAETCDRTYVMYGGRIVEHGLPGGIFRSPQHPYTVGLVRASRLERSDDGKFYSIPGDSEVADTGCVFKYRCEFAFDACDGQHPPHFAAIRGGTPDGEVACWLHDPQLKGKQ